MKNCYDNAAEEWNVAKLTYKYWWAGGKFTAFDYLDAKDFYLNLRANLIKMFFFQTS